MFPAEKTNRTEIMEENTPRSCVNLKKKSNLEV